MTVKTVFHNDLCFILWRDMSGYRSKRDNPKRRQPKRRHAKTATHPKRRHVKTLHVAVLVCTSPFRIQPKQRHAKTATNPKRRHVKTATIQLDWYTKLIQNAVFYSNTIKLHCNFWNLIQIWFKYMARVSIIVQVYYSGWNVVFDMIYCCRLISRQLD